MTENPNAPATVEERYTTAATTSDLTVKAEKGGAGDVLIAAGFSPHLVGTALIRLHGEWDRAEKPRPLGRSALDALARTIAKEQGADTPTDVHRKAAKAQAAEWLEYENRMLLGKLKTLAYIQAQVHKWALEHEIPDYRAQVAAAILWWLAPNCPACHGRRWEPIPGTPKLSNRSCQVCQGGGQRSIPNGLVGRQIVAFLDDCVNLAHAGMRAKLRHHQPDAVRRSVA